MAVVHVVKLKTDKFSQAAQGQSEMVDCISEATLHHQHRLLSFRAESGVIKLRDSALQQRQV